MICSSGKCRIDGIEIGEVSINLLAHEPILTAKYALVNGSTATRFGAGTRNQWSLETQQRLTDLIAAMEKDCLSDCFEEGDTILSGDSSPYSTRDDIPSL